ncbi:gamma-interferon-inducible lysosomal thiol reductase-like isoform X2 [Apostichopus japonicus]|uniref:gamma-interferon-inducible lysosomal thiol reductase-like isoform X2 n=1 Tax=Stichopus japonicus TaxID=307972 RepID=UPI003AB5F506
MVEQQCQDWKTRSHDPAPPVNVTVYIESLCPDCRNFIKKMLYPTWKTLENTGIMNLQLVPYGNAEETAVGDKWNFTCQHGAMECWGNLLETCTLHFEKFPTAFDIIHCAEVATFPIDAYSKCVTKFGADFDQINECAKGDLGNQLEHEMALQTAALVPPHKYVPWVTVNGDHTEDMEKKAEADLLSLVCSTYQGTQPKECQPTKIFL